MAWVNELPYIPDSSRLFSVISTRPWAMFLDSGFPLARGGRWDILTADPITTFVTQDGVTTQYYIDDEKVFYQDPFTLLRQVLGATTKSIPQIPFAGGALGWFSYDLARYIEKLPVQAINQEQLPDLAIGIFDWAVVVDHKLRRTWLASHGQYGQTKDQWSQLLHMWHNAATSTIQHQPFQTLETLRSNITFDEYRQAFQRIKHYICNGHCYQVNFAQRFATRAEGDPWLAYQSLRKLNPAPFAAYLQTPYGQILSSSPERFLTVRNRHVITQPIKGTCPRGKTLEEDIQLGQRLQASVKERAENLMIVDLLRNDLGRVCIPGSIQVPNLFSIEQYSTVQHLVSTVVGELAPGKDSISLLRACFPGGSITGAPKLRAMQIIEELEPQRRGAYCGSIGYIGFDNAMDTNIAIRTLVYNNGCIRFWAGGGIIHDSVLEHEYQEIHHKAQALIQLLHNFTKKSNT
ncbi:aminodeoxychorismate synthase [Achromatium sp. WMS1]|nr:aminodeoxychorismate synthase [Achromatium sp. WMS1]